MSDIYQRIKEKKIGKSHRRLSYAEEDWLIEQYEAHRSRLRAAIDVLVSYRDCLISSYTIGARYCEDKGFIEDAQIRDDIHRLNELIAVARPDDDRGRSAIDEYGCFGISEELKDQIIMFEHDYDPYRDTQGDGYTVGDTHHD